MLKPIAATPLQRMTVTQLTAFFVSLIEHPYSQSMLDKAFQLLKMTFREAVKREIIRKSPLDDVRHPKAKKATAKIRALTETEQQRLIKVLTTEDILYSNQMLISMLTGMRMGEVNALTVRDVDFNRHVIHVHATISKGENSEAVLKATTKTYAGKRDIPMTPDVESILRECIRVMQTGDMPSVGHLFHNGAGHLVPTASVNYQFTRVVLARYPIEDEFSTAMGKITLHSLRHTYATCCIEAGMPANVLQKLLGHTDIKVTMNTYADVFDRYRDREIEKVNAYMLSLGLTLDAGKASAQQQL